MSQDEKNEANIQEMEDLQQLEHDIAHLQSVLAQKIKDLQKEKNKEKKHAKRKEYYEMNKEKACVKQKEYYEKNKEKKCAKQKEYREK